MAIMERLGGAKNSPYIRAEELAALFQVHKSTITRMRQGLIGGKKILTGHRVGNLWLYHRKESIAALEKYFREQARA